MPFQDLSAELVDHIAAYLDGISLGAFRLVSRECDERSCRQFAQYIRDLRFLVAPHSLGILLSIAKHERFGPTFEKVRLGTYYLDYPLSRPSIVHDPLHGEADEDRTAVTKSQIRLNDYIEAQAAFRRGDDVAVLSTVFSHLPKLEELEIGEWCYDRSTRDPPRCYGMTAVETEIVKTCGLYTTNSYRDDMEISGLDHTFEVALRALALTRKPVKKLSSQCCLPECGYQKIVVHCISTRTMFPLMTYHVDGLEVAFNSLRSLSMSVSFSPGHMENGSLAWEHWLPRFVSLARQLEHLSLTFDGWEDGFVCTDSLLGFEVFAKEVAMPNLISLELSNLELSFVDLLMVSQKIKRTLIKLELHHVQLEDDQWTERLYHLCHQEFSRLHDIKLSWLFERGSGELGRVVLFEFEDQDTNCCETCTDYTCVMTFAECRHTCKTLTYNDLGQIKLLETRLKETPRGEER